MYNLQDYSIWFANLLNIEISNKIAVDDIFKYLSQIQNVEAFRQFSIDKLTENKGDYSYMGSLEKLHLLMKQYNKFEFEANNSESLEKSEDEAVNLGLKVDSVCTDVICYWKEYKDYPDFFTPYELKTLQKIGSLWTCAKLVRDSMRGDALTPRIREMYKQVIHNRVSPERKALDIARKALR